MCARSRSARLGVGLVLICLIARTAAALTSGSQVINTTRTTPVYTHQSETHGDFAWDVKYVRSFDGTVLKNQIKIDFTFTGTLNYTPQQKQAYKDAAETNVEAIWNHKYSVRDNATNILYPIVLDMTTSGPFDQTVVVRNSQGQSDPPYDMLNWYVSEDIPASQAHEVGHMVGLYDEYIGGAIDQYPNPTLSDHGLMGYGALEANPIMYARYFQQYLDYIQLLNPTASFSLVAVPEPAATLFLTLMAASFLRRRDIMK